jgi:hypothetical protein
MVIIPAGVSRHDTVKTAKVELRGYVLATFRRLLTDEVFQEMAKADALDEWLEKAMRGDAAQPAEKSQGGEQREGVELRVRVANYRKFNFG